MFDIYLVANISMKISGNKDDKNKDTKNWMKCRFGVNSSWGEKTNRHFEIHIEMLIILYLR